MKTKNEISEFWNNIQRENHGKVRFKTFAILLGKSEDVFLNITGILFIIDHRMIFENFEKGRNRFLFVTRKEKFQKYKIGFSVEEIMDIKEVSSRTAYRCISGSMKHSETKVIGRYYRFLTKNICQIRLRFDYSLFFDLLDSRKLISFLKEYEYSR